MAGHIPGDSSNHGRIEGGSSSSSPDEGGGGGRWYFSRKEIEESTPSRRDSIDLKKETYLRKSYCTFVQDLGMRLKVPQVTIATAIIFCHRFFLRHSHAKNDRRTISTVCMFLAGKVEETPRPLKDVILVSYDIIHKKDPIAAQRIKQKEVYEQQKELILLGERLVLATLAFDLNVHHPYKPLVEAIKKFKVEKHALAQVAWNFVNDGLRTSLCLQFQPHHIAAGAIFLAAKFLKVKLPSDGEKVWWQEFDVTPRQLEEVSNQMLELYEQNRVPPSQGSEVEGSTAGGKNLRPSTRNPSVHEEHVPTNGPIQAVVAVKTGISLQSSSRPPTDQPNDENNHNKPPISKQNHSNESMEMGSVITDHNVDAEVRGSDHSEQLLSEENTSGPNKSKPGLNLAGTDDQGRNGGRGVNMELREGQVGQSPRDTIKMIDKDKVKAALEKRKKSRGGDMARKKDLMDEDDLIERALEDGVELAVEDEKIRQERRQRGTKIDSPSPRKVEVENVEEGEMLDGASPTLINRKRKRSPLDRQTERKQTLPPH